MVKCNKDIDDMESMLIAREKGKNIISYVDFSKTCHVIKFFPCLKQKIGKEDITSTISSSSRDIEWRETQLSQLEQ